MNTTLTNALWITLVGMGLVFLSLLLLWGLIALLVYVTGWRANAKGEPESPAEPISTGEESALAPGDTAHLRQQAAAAAVAVALAQKGESLRKAVNQPAREPTSAWQPVLRANQLNQHMKMYSRKQRGNA